MDISSFFAARGVIEAVYGFFDFLQVSFVVTLIKRG
jgi:hypothetical protein